MQILIFTDLDDTLFQSARKKPPQEDWQALAFLKNGDPICWASPKQLAFLDWLQHGGALLIPVTARNLDAFLRVRIAFRGPAIIDYGGIILNPEGQADEDWLARSRVLARAALPALLRWQNFLEEANKALQGDVAVRLISDFETPFYVAAKSSGNRCELVQDLAVRCRQALDSAALPAMTLHCNHNNLALLPPWLDKGRAVRRVLLQFEAEHGPAFSLGMGDSLIDLSFLRVCDARLVPGESQLDQVLVHSGDAFRENWP